MHAILHVLTSFTCLRQEILNYNVEVHGACADCLSALQAWGGII